MIQRRRHTRLPALHKEPAAQQGRDSGLNVVRAVTNRRRKLIRRHIGTGVPEEIPQQIGGTSAVCLARNELLQKSSLHAASLTRVSARVSDAHTDGTAQRCLKKVSHTPRCIRRLFARRRRLCMHHRLDGGEQRRVVEGLAEVGAEPRSPRPLAIVGAGQP